MVHTYPKMNNLCLNSFMKICLLTPNDVYRMLDIDQADGQKARKTVEYKLTRAQTE